MLALSTGGSSPSQWCAGIIIARSWRVERARRRKPSRARKETRRGGLLQRSVTGTSLARRVGRAAMRPQLELPIDFPRGRGDRRALMPNACDLRAVRPRAEGKHLTPARKDLLAAPWRPALDDRSETSRGPRPATLDSDTFRRLDEIIGRAGSAANRRRRRTGTGRPPSRTHRSQGGGGGGGESCLPKVRRSPRRRAPGHESENRPCRPPGDGTDGGDRLLGRHHGDHLEPDSRTRSRTIAARRVKGSTRMITIGPKRWRRAIWSDRSLRAIWTKPRTAGSRLGPARMGQPSLPSIGRTRGRLVVEDMDRSEFIFW